VQTYAQISLNWQDSKMIGCGEMLQKSRLWTEGRFCPSIEFEFAATNMGHDFSVPINPITRFVPEKTQARDLREKECARARARARARERERGRCRLTREELNEFTTLSLPGSSNLSVSFQIFPQQTKSINGHQRPRHPDRIHGAGTRERGIRTLTQI